MRSLNTHTREGGLSVKIVLARFAPSKNANLSKSANFRLASLTPLATNPSAQLYGGLVTMLSAPDYCFVLGLRRRPCRRNHFPSSAKSSGNEPVLDSHVGQGGRLWARSSRQHVCCSASASSWLMLSMRIGRADGYGPLHFSECRSQHHLAGGFD